jgi:hypothetical protein
MLKPRPQYQRELSRRAERKRVHLMKLVTAGAVAAIGLGLGAASASAYSIDGIGGNPYNYTGAPALPSSDHSLTIGGAYTITCPKADTAFTGTATGAAQTSFTPYWGAANGTGEVCEFYGFPAKVTQSGMWNLTVTGNSGSTYTGQITIPSGSVTTIDIPITGCTYTVGGPQAFTHGSGGTILTAVNATGGVNLTAVVNNVAFASTAPSCPFTTADRAIYNSNGPISFPGIRINP